MSRSKTEKIRPEDPKSLTFDDGRGPARRYSAAIAYIDGYLQKMRHDDSVNVDAIVANTTNPLTSTTKPQTRRPQ